MINKKMKPHTFIMSKDTPYLIKEQKCMNLLKRCKSLTDILKIHPECGDVYTEKLRKEIFRVRSYPDIRIFN